MSTEYLKDRYVKKIRYGFLPFNLIVFWGLVMSRLDLSGFQSLWSSISLKESMIAMVASIGTFILDGVLSAINKTRIVYWRYHNPLPGSRAFSHHLIKEPRAKRDLLIEKWEELPTDSFEQNSLWYRMFKEYESDISVVESHHAWLFSRDLTAFACLFLVLFSGVILISETPWSISASYIACLGLQYLVCMLAARNYGIRFVQTVLAAASSKQRNAPDIETVSTRI